MFGSETHTFCRGVIITLLCLAGLGACDSGSGDTNTNTNTNGNANSNVNSNANSNANENTNGNALPDGVSVLASLDPEAAFDDLGAFGAAFGNVPVVGIGEMAHRQTEFLTMRHRLTRYLIAEHGFRLVALETEWTDAELLDTYIHGDCQDDPTQVLLDGSRDLWHAPTIADLLRWICQRNAANPGDQVSIIGFNNFQPWHDGTALITFVEAMMTSQATQLAAEISGCEGVIYSSEEEYWLQDGSADSAERAACHAALDTVEAYFDANEAAIIAASSADELTVLRLHLESLRSWEDYSLIECGLVSPADGISMRDAAMARIFLDLRELRLPGAKSVVMAHDLHLATDTESWDCVYPQMAADLNVEEGTVRMGVHLASALGDDYAPIGLRAWSYFLGISSAVSFESHIPGAPQSPALAEQVMRDLGQPLFFADVRDVGAASPLFAPGAEYLFGIPFSGPAGLVLLLMRAVPTQGFSGYVYIDEAYYYE